MFTITGIMSRVQLDIYYVVTVDIGTSILLRALSFGLINLKSKARQLNCEKFLNYFLYSFIVCITGAAAFFFYDVNLNICCY